MAFLFLFLILLSFFASPATTKPSYFICGSTGKFTSNTTTTYSTNLKILLSNLSSTAPATSFATTTTGTIPNLIFGLTLCRGDTDTALCHSCITTATSVIQKVCQYNKEASIWDDYCQLHYSNQDFLNNPDITSNTPLYIDVPTTNLSAYQLLLYEAATPALIGNLSDLAVRNPSRMFATGETVLAAGNIVYGLVQCTRHLSVHDCLTCLKGSMDQITLFPLKGRMGGRTMGMWCNMRYQPNKFYNGTSMLHLPSPFSPLQPNNNGSSTPNITQPNNGSNKGNTDAEIR